MREGKVLNSCTDQTVVKETKETTPYVTLTKLDKDFWLNVLRRGLKNLDASVFCLEVSVLNRVGKSEISVLDRVRV